MDFRSLFNLRRHLIESGVSLNSTFNQLFFFFALGFLVYLNSKKRISKIFMFFSLSLAAFVLFFSLSRQNILALFFFLAVFYFMHNKAYLIVFGFVAVTLATLVYFNSDLEAFSHLISRLAKTGDQLNSDNFSRMHQFMDSLSLGFSNPFYGVGIGGFYDYAMANGYNEITAVPEAALNQISSEMGIMTLILYVFLYTYMFWLLIHQRKKLKNFDCHVSLAQSNALISLFVSMMLLSLFNEVHIQVSFWFLIIFYYRILDGRMRKYLED